MRNCYRTHGLGPSALALCLSVLGCGAGTAPEPSTPIVENPSAAERELFRSKCRSANAEACYHLAHSLDQVRQREEVRANLQRACELKHYVACTEDLYVATLLTNALLLKDACTKAGVGCSYAGWALREAKDEAGAQALYRHGCERGDGKACGSLANTFSEEGTNGSKPTAATVAYWEKACSLEDGWSCKWASNAYRDGVGAQQNPDRAFKLYRLAAAYFALDCAAFDAEACYGLASIYETDEYRKMCQSQQCDHTDHVNLGLNGIQLLASFACFLGRSNACLTAGKPLEFNDIEEKTSQ